MAAAAKPFYSNFGYGLEGGNYHKAITAGMQVIRGGRALGLAGLRRSAWSRPSWRVGGVGGVGGSAWSVGRQVGEPLCC